jgi:hypothetical protein
MHLYCTYFDHRFLTRGLAMIRSLRRVDPGCRVTVLCLTEACERVLAAAAEPGVTLVRLEDFERENPDVLAIKDTRSLRDYYFTLSGCLSAWMLKQAKPQEVLTYVDADLYFYASPAPLFAAMENASVGLISHRHHWWTRRLEKFGRFNVGWVSFRSDPIGWLAATWWRERCIEWCYGIADGDRFADQKYLDHMFAKFPKVVEIAHPGANIGPWNVSRHRIAGGAGESFVVDGGFPLIFVHYSGVSKAGRGLYQCSNVSYLGPFPQLVREGLYAPYLAELERIHRALGLPDKMEADERGSPRLRRRLLAPVLRMAGRLAGHYIRPA